MIIARKIVVSGIVQGVGYRFFTQRSAARHQVLGYVQNLADGSVECCVEGEEASIQEFVNDLTAGPTYARVQNVEETVLDPKGLFTSFLIEK